ncbi:MAG: hypothetical protein IJL94_02530 [Erysipelotrichaceae bacterium]|nr:hypothetical protein [Erysipelotrichaceae bacterium]
MKTGKKVLITLLTALMLLTGCSNPVNNNGNNNNNNSNPEVIKRTKYGDSIVDYLYNLKNGNVIISNVSINMALAMLLEGTNGESQKQLEEYLGFSKEDAKNISKELLDYLRENISKQTETTGWGEEISTGLGFVEMANSLWLNANSSIKEEYRILLEQYFYATAQSLNFLDSKSADIINGWVSDKTHGLIKEIVDKDVLAELYMILINALYMKGAWAEKYYGKGEGLFNGEVVDVLKSVEREYFENDKATAFGKSICGGFEMIAILPKEEGEFTLEELDIEGLLKTGTMDYDVTTSIPAFDLKYDTSLTDVLKALGVKDVFDPFVSDLSDIRDIVGDSRLYVSDVIHKTNVKIDENGFEGAAVTAILVKDTAVSVPVQRPKKEVIIDRPFVFMIIDRNTGTAIFTGKVVNLNK